MDLFDIAEADAPEKVGNDLSHIIGSKDEDVRFLPDLSKKPIEKDARRDYSEREKWALIEEEGEAHNASKIDVTGTHYEGQTPQEIAQMIMPLKGF